MKFHIFLICRSCLYFEPDGLKRRHLVAAQNVCKLLGVNTAPLLDILEAKAGCDAVKGRGE